MLASALESGLSLVRHFALVDVPELVQLFSNSASNLNEILRAAHPLSLVRERLRAAPDRVLDALAPAGTICLALVLAIVAFKRCICFIRATLHRAARPVDAEALLPKRSTRTRGGAAEMQHGFWLSRVLLLRAMGCVYLAAFLTSAFQSRALFGTRGLAPAGASKRPTIAYDALRSHLGEADLALECLSWVGVTFSLLLAFGSSYFALWAPLPAALWLCYLSVVNLGARVVIGYGWEWGTLEVGFLMMFLCAEWPPRDSFPRALPPPSSVLWLLRWYVFRMLLGAGMSKLGSRSSACWRDLSCTSTHYFTQPMPTPAAWVFHKLPASVHKVEVALTFFEQLVLPFGALVPIRAVQRFVALAEIFFQLMVISTGNYAWINWLAVVPAIALLDDGLLRHFVPSAMADAAAAAQSASRDGDGDDDGDGDGDDDDDDDDDGDGACDDDDGNDDDDDDDAVDDAQAHEDAGATAVGGSIACASATGAEEAKAASHDGDVASGASPRLAQTAPAYASLHSSSPDSWRFVDELQSSASAYDVGRRRASRSKPPRGTSAEAVRADSAERRGRRLASRAYRWYRRCCHAALVVVIACKSAAPLKELFSPSPWLAFYDDLFLVNAQGVFGFVNSHRTTLALSFTHDALPKRGADAECADRPGVVVRDGAGRPFTCAKLARAGGCEQEQGFAQLCPEACGICALRPDLALKSLKWNHLHFANLPGGDMTRAPRFSAPYHHRLDWEVWIHTTASMERHVIRAYEMRSRTGGELRPEQLPHIALPSVVRQLVNKVLDGDTDAIGLLGTPLSELLRPEESVNASDTAGGTSLRLRPPTAVRAQFIALTFSSPLQLLRDGVWWESFPISKPVHIEWRADAANGRTTRRSAPQRRWLLLFAAIALAVSIDAAASALARIVSAAAARQRSGDGRNGRSGLGRARAAVRPMLSFGWSVLSAAHCATLLALSLLTDYPRVCESALRQLCESAFRRDCESASRQKCIAADASVHLATSLLAIGVLRALSSGAFCAPDASARAPWPRLLWRALLSLGLPALILWAAAEARYTHKLVSIPQ